MVKPSKPKGLAAKSSDGVRGKAASSKKQGKGDIYTFDDDSDGGAGTKRNHRRAKSRMQAGGDSDDGGSDSDNQYAVKPGDDDSIDDSGSEVGWGSADEDAFGLAIAANKKKGSSKGKSKGGKKGKVKKFAADSGSESDGDASMDSSLDGQEVEGGMLLSDLLGAAKPSAATSSASKGKGAGKSSSKDVDLFLDGDESEDDISIEYSGEESEEEEDHSKLMSAIEKFAKDSEGKTSQKTKKSDKQFMKESEFELDAPKLSISTLLGALDDVKGVSVVKNQLSELDKGKKAVPKMVDKVVADRVERKVTYSETKADMDKWQAVVVENRHAKSLDLAGDERQLASYKTLVDKFEPTNDFERDINMVLIQSNTSEEAAAKLEEDALKARNLTPEEIKEKMAEMSKIRALMFYEQMKRHRINKIKSKAYHRIKKRQLKNKLAREGGGGDLDDSADEGEEDGETEQQALDRVKERMDLRHKNTSKWAKMALQHGHANKDLRMAYHEAVQMGHDLTKRVDRTDKDDNGDDSASHGSSDESSSEGVDTKKLAGKLHKALAENEEDDTQIDGKFKKLFAMDFMKNAKLRQQDKAREEAAMILKEIVEMDAGDVSDDNAGVNDARSSGENKSDDATRKKNIVDAKRLQDAKAMMEGLYGADSSKTSRALPVKQSISAAKSNLTEEANPWLDSVAGIDRALDKEGGSKKRKADEIRVSVPALSEVITVSAAPAKDTANKKEPSTASNKPSGTGKNVKMASSVPSKATSSGVIAPVVPPQTALVDKPTAAEKEAVDVDSAPSKKAKKQVLVQRSQEDLVREAFAGPDLEAEFAAMKREAVDNELDIDLKKQKILSQAKPGWGEWAGAGLSGINAKTEASRKRQLSAMEEESAKQRAMRKDGKMMNVVISDRRIKTAAKYKISDIPHPFTSREEYERSIQMPLGEEWNASHIVRKNTKPEVMTRAGRIIAPIALPKQQQVAKGISGASAAPAKKKAPQPRKPLQ